MEIPWRRVAKISMTVKGGRPLATTRRTLRCNGGWPPLQVLHTAGEFCPFETALFSSGQITLWPKILLVTTYRSSSEESYSSSFTHFPLEKMSFRKCCRPPLALGGHFVKRLKKFSDSCLIRDIGWCFQCCLLAWPEPFVLPCRWTEIITLLCVLSSTSWRASSLNRWL